VELGWNEVIRPEQLIFGPTLGAGGSAQVYRGSWQGQEVAIKKISGVAHLEEMTKEINALRRLRHPRLVRFIGACIQPPLLLVVTEFMSGGSLHDRLFDQKGKYNPLSSTQRGMIALQMCEGLSFLHGQRIVHRDLKSMNILLDGGGNAKICDFGLAQQMNMEATHITRKQEGEGGSPRYMAPECYDPRHGKLTEKVDIWALGCIFIEVFAGVLPYADCMTMAQLSARILVQKQPPQVPTSVAPALRSLTATCFSFNPDKRPAATDLQQQLPAHIQRN
jgi:serine/threonine protein kinase